MISSKINCQVFMDLIIDENVPTLKLKLFSSIKFS